MSEVTQMYTVVVEATLEIRDADGNLVSAEPVQTEAVVDEQTAIELGYTKETP